MIKVVPDMAINGNVKDSGKFLLSLNLNSFVENGGLDEEMKKELNEAGTISKLTLIKILKNNIEHVTEEQVVQTSVEEVTLIKILKNNIEHVTEEQLVQTNVEEPVGVTVITVSNGDHKIHAATNVSHSVAMTTVETNKLETKCENDAEKSSTSNWWHKRVKKLAKNAKHFGEIFNEKSKNPCVRYLSKMKGGGKSPPFESRWDAVISFITSFIGIAIVSAIDQYSLSETPNSLVIGSFGATAVLLFTAVKSPLAQPRNLILGHLIGALVGPTMHILLGAHLAWLAAALAVSLTMAIMCMTNTVHPPAGATAIIAVYSSDKIHNVGFFYVIMPVGVGVLILLAVALLTNNLFPTRKYPQYWW